MTFKELKIDENILEAIRKKNFDEMTDIQAEAIPPALAGQDILGQAQTGTGKTAAFSIPVLNAVDKNNQNLQCLVLVPTRELAIQVKNEIMSLSGNKIEPVAIYGGDPIDKQMKLLKNKPQIVVGTPGRSIDLINRKKLKIEQIDFFVLDEVDEMLNMGFIDDVEFIASKTPKHKQTLLFSATLPDKIKKIANKYLNNPKIIKVASKSLTADRVEQHYIIIKQKQKNLILKNIIDINNEDKIIIFTQTKRSADEVSDFLLSHGFLVGKIHGDLPQATRTKTIEKFRQNKIKYLVATDVVARGIDIDNVNLVINYELPQDIEYYIHRIGRTGRGMAAKGQSITLVTPRAYETEFKYYSKRLKIDIKKQEKPELKDVIDILKKKYLEEILKQQNTEDIVYKELAQELLKLDNPEEIISKILFRLYPQISKKENLKLIEKDEYNHNKNSRKSNSNNRSNGYGDKKRNNNNRNSRNSGSGKGYNRNNDRQGNNRNTRKNNKY